MADRIAAHTGQTRGDEAIDVFLGRLERDGDGVDVHGRAARALSREDGETSEPTELHRGLLRLYRKHDELRLVTTNFDELFEKAALGVFGELPEVFRAPALPLGSDFTGIVHLHGSVRDPKGMVLTDRDFGRAYLKRGWARRFSLELFQARTVLFVGYRHEDVDLSYLARALPPAAATQRFALVGSREPERVLARWRSLGVNPIVYRQAGRRDHDALPVGVARLAALVRRGTLEWQRTIRDFASTVPPSDQESNDLLEYCLGRSEHVRFFVESAEHQDWVGWLEQRGFLDGLFDERMYDERANRLGQWLLRRFGADHSAVLFSLIARHGNRVVAGFWRSAFFVLIQEDDVELEDETLSKWVSLLLECVPRDPDVRWFLPRIAARCSNQGLVRDIVRVFETFLAPLLCSLDAVRGRSTVGDTPNVQYSFDEVWTGSVAPHLSEIAEPLLECSVALLEGRQDLLEVWCSAEGGADPELRFRAAIEPHERDPPERRGPVDMAINAARDALDWLGEHREEVALPWCDRLIRSRSVSLRRLAVHGVSGNRGLSCDEQVDWLLEKTDLHDQNVRHEVFRVAGASYPGASDGRRQRFVQRVLEFCPPSAGDVYPEFAAHSKLNWLVWLEAAVPDCSHVRSAIRDVRAQFPQVQARDHPDLGRSFGVSKMYRVERVSPLSVDEMLDQDPEDFVAWLPSDVPEDALGPDGRLVNPAGGLVDAVEECVERSPAWSVGVANALLDKGRLDDRLWPTLLSGLGAAEESLFRDVIRLYGEPELQVKYSRAIAEALRSILAERAEHRFANDLAALLDVAEGLWEAVPSLPALAVEREQVGGWSDRAIRDAAEPLAMFWIHALEALHREGRATPRGADHVRVLAALTAITQSDTEFGAASLSILASQLRFLLAVEEAWTRDELLPLFTLEAAADRAMLHEAVWDGFLLLGRLDPDAAEALRLAFRDIAPSARELPDWKREQFVQHATVMAIYFSDDPRREWVPLVLGSLPKVDRQRFAWMIEKHLEQADSETSSEWWHRWLEQYWLDRLEGVPERLTPGETAVMFRWLSKLSAVFGEAVSLAVQMPRPPSALADIDLEGIRSTCPVSEHTADMAKLVLCLGEFELSLLDEREIRALIEELLDAELSEGTKNSLRELAVRRGFVR